MAASENSSVPYTPAEIAVITALQSLPIAVIEGELISSGSQRRSDETLRKKRQRLRKDGGDFENLGAQVDGLEALEKALSDRQQLVREHLGRLRREHAARV